MKKKRKFHVEVLGVGDWPHVSDGDEYCFTFDVSPERKVTVAVASTSPQASSPLFARWAWSRRAKREGSSLFRGQIQRIDRRLFDLGVKPTSRSRRALSWLNYVICTRWGFYWK